MHRLNRFLIALVALLTGLNMVGETAFARTAAREPAAQTEIAQAQIDATLAVAEFIQRQTAPGRAERAPQPPRRPEDADVIRIPSVQLTDRLRE